MSGRMVCISCSFLPACMTFKLPIMRRTTVWSQNHGLDHHCYGACFDDPRGDVIRFVASLLSIQSTEELALACVFMYPASGR